jgi:hypothetical protein
MSTPELRDPRLDAAYRDAPREEPPAELDARVRAAAHRAVAAAPRSLGARARRSALAGWRLPLSIAATALIAVTVSLMVREEESILSRPEAPAPAAAPAAPAVTPEPPTPAGEAQTRDEAAPAPFKREPATAAPAARPAIPPPPAERPTSREERPWPGTASDAAAPSDRERPAPARASAAKRGAAPAAPALEQAAPRSPELWLEEIRRLRAEGREDEAAAELAELARRYPDFRLPPDLAR